MRKEALPIVFRCSLPGNSRGWEGRAEMVRQGNSMAELIIAGRGSRMNAVIGKYSSGQYICIPDLDTGCPLSSLADVFWNRERLSGHMPEADAITIACALKEVSGYLGGGWA